MILQKSLYVAAQETFINIFVEILCFMILLLSEVLNEYKVQMKNLYLKYNFMLWIV